MGSVTVATTFNDSQIALIRFATKYIVSCGLAVRRITVSQHNGLKCRVLMVRTVVKNTFTYLEVRVIVRNSVLGVSCIHILYLCCCLCESSDIHTVSVVFGSTTC